MKEYTWVVSTLAFILEDSYVRLSTCINLDLSWQEGENCCFIGGLPKAQPPVWLICRRDCIVDLLEQMKEFERGGKAPIIMCVHILLSVVLNPCHELSVIELRRRMHINCHGDYNTEIESWMWLNGRRSCNGGESLLLSTIKPVHVHIGLRFFISTKLTMVLALAQNKKQLNILDSMNAGRGIFSILWDFIAGFYQWIHHTTD